MGRKMSRRRKVLRGGDTMKNIGIVAVLIIVIIGLLSKMIPDKGKASATHASNEEGRLVAVAGRVETEKTAYERLIRAQWPVDGMPADVVDNLIQAWGDDGPAVLGLPRLPTSADRGGEALWVLYGLIKGAYHVYTLQEPDRLAELFKLISTPEAAVNAVKDGKFGALNASGQMNCDTDFGGQVGECFSLNHPLPEALKGYAPDAEAPTGDLP